jgi:predicted RNase H-like nuclease (RuvC/YqgF family)
MGLLKTVIRLGLVTAAVAGGIALLAGPHRTSALFNQAKDSLNETLDEAIDDPTALRSQLRELEAQYPERISDVRGDLAELTEQIRQLEREKSIAERVVSLTDKDLSALQPAVSQSQTASMSGMVVPVAFGNAVLQPKEAVERVDQIARTRSAYATRAGDATRDLGYLAQQQSRLESLLGRLEAERTEFRSQIWQLDRQVDAIARNDRLIELMEKRQKTLDECSRYDAVSLESLKAQMAEVRSQQEAELELLAKDQDRLDYEDVARQQLDVESVPGAAIRNQPAQPTQPALQAAPGLPMVLLPAVETAQR